MDDYEHERDFDITFKRGLETINIMSSFHEKQHPLENVDESVIYFWSIYMQAFSKGSSTELVHCFEPSDYKRLRCLKNRTKNACYESLFTQEAMRIAKAKKVLMFPYEVGHVHALAVIINPQNLCVEGKKCEWMVFSKNVGSTLKESRLFLGYLKELYWRMGRKVFSKNFEKLRWSKASINVPNSAIYVMAWIELIYRQPTKFLTYTLAKKPYFRYSELAAIEMQLSSERPYKAIHHAIRQFDSKINPKGYMPENPIALLEHIIDEPPIYHTID